MSDKRTPRPGEVTFNDSASLDTFPPLGKHVDAVPVAVGMDPGVPGSEMTVISFPAGQAAAAILAYLRENAEVAWEVQKTLMVLGPWEKVGVVWQRCSESPLADDNREALIQRYGRTRYQWFGPRDRSIAPTLDDAMSATDAFLRAAGWLLVDPKCEVKP